MLTVNDILLPTIINLIGSFIFLFGDINIIVATIRYKSLQHPCNYLIAFNALADVINECSYYVFSVFVFSGNLYTTRMICDYWQLIPSFAGQCSLALVLAIGFDRMIGVVMPMRYGCIFVSMPEPGREIWRWAQ
jgi:hypothetical protein